MAQYLIGIGICLLGDVSVGKKNIIACRDGISCSRVIVGAVCHW